MLSHAFFKRTSLLEHLAIGFP